MPTQEKQKKSSGNVQALIAEVQDLHDTIEEIHLDIKKLKPKTGFAKTADNFLQGLIRGVALGIGTTLFAGLILYGIFRVASSPTVKKWINESVQSAIEETVGNAVSEGIGNSIPF